VQDLKEHLNSVENLRTYFLSEGNYRILFKEAENMTELLKFLLLLTLSNAAVWLAANLGSTKDNRLEVSSKSIVCGHV